MTGLVWRNGDEPFPGPWLPISSAPRDGRLITVMDLDSASVEMWWNSTGTNAAFQSSCGIWQTLDGQFTWSEERGWGPTYWRPCSAELEQFLLLINRNAREAANAE
ncbi:hypothetical protein [Novosphingobium sp. AP12]|uniref:hypothetical protein n=1 Tax=Novosphingobium sp. AP12 TaxID=1144305 RepID=UPI00027205DD|nr:hypothetical protein [Novosphingobium sp. AP12]EJL23961.1 hypothetical protein PMI02_03881 [Novosphingobium sp. AP12]